MNFDNLLKKHHLKITPQRVAILNNMHQFGHIAVDELFIHVKKQFSSISLATLYKNIHVMLETSLIKEVNIPHNKPKYEIIKEAHAHLLCTTCNSLEDIFIDTSSLIQNMKEQSHFLIQESDLIFSGICTKCQKIV